MSNQGYDAPQSDFLGKIWVIPEKEPIPEPHDVKFHIGNEEVVCTCGDYFRSAVGTHIWEWSAVAKWAKHVHDKLEDWENVDEPQ